MSGWLFHLLYGAIRADFESSFSIEESVRRLSAATERSLLKAFTREAAVGHVSKDRVSIRRVIPFVGNSCKPFYIGEFREANGLTVLTGRFTMLGAVKACITVWFGFCLLWTVLSLALLLMRHPNTWWLPFIGVGMFASGVALVAFCKRLARNDTPWLSKVIRDALSEKPPQSHLPLDVPQAARP